MPYIPRTNPPKYFDQDFDRTLCNGTCDNCARAHTYLVKDLSEAARSALTLVTAMASQRVTLKHVADVFKGSRTSKIQASGHDQLRGYGQGEHLHKGDIDRLLRTMVLRDVLTEYPEENREGFIVAYVGVGPRAGDLKAGRLAITLSMRDDAKKRDDGAADGSKRKKARLVGGSGGQQRQPAQLDMIDDGDDVEDDDDDVEERTPRRVAAPQEPTQQRQSFQARAQQSRPATPATAAANPRKRASPSSGRPAAATTPRNAAAPRAGAKAAPTPGRTVGLRPLIAL